ncbi:MAG: glycosyltransferase family 39 protein [Acidocella sp.]|nr:glycosyltransferase family 39 protein [Acidocella sp.]
MRLLATLLFAAAVLTTIAYVRPPEYDEAYSIFLTSAHARPPWPTGVFTPTQVRALFIGNPGLGQIATDLRTGDVHPPLYFWLLDQWRHISGPGWFAARLLSVLVSLVGLIALGWAARLLKTPVLATILITLLAYGFAYTSITARGFALAQFFNLLGFALYVRHSRVGKSLPSFAAGLAFGAASFSNYLAIFTPLGLLGSQLIIHSTRGLHASGSRLSTVLTTSLGIACFIPADLYFFLAQRGSRTGQFAPFHLVHALELLAKDQAAALFGGLPLYAGSFAPLVIIALAVLSIVCAIAIIKHHNAARFTPTLTLTAAATPLGLLALGVIFNNTPIEIRYCAFSLPYIGLLCASIKPATLRNALLFTESLGIIGLAFAPATAQPQAAAAVAANSNAHILVLLPYGNDGVGIPGPFIAAAQPAMRIILIHGATLPDLSAEPRVILATLMLDDASKTAIPKIESELTQQWQLTAQTPLTRAYQQRGFHQQP